MTAPQLALPLATAPRFADADLLPNPAQDQARAWLDRTAEWPGNRLALWGAPGSGKTHLLHAWAERHGARVLPAAPPGWPPGPLAIDGLDHIPDEPALFHLLNAAAEANQPLLLASTLPPARLAIRLPDLASRLRAALAVEIGPAPDSFLALLLARLLADRQVQVPAPVQAWLLARLPRTPDAVRTAAARLDAAALAAGRRIDRALAAETLQLNS